MKIKCNGHCLKHGNCPLVTSNHRSGYLPCMKDNTASAKKGGEGMLFIEPFTTDDSYGWYQDLVTKEFVVRKITQVSAK